MKRAQYIANCLRQMIQEVSEVDRWKVLVRAARAIERVVYPTQAREINVLLSGQETCLKCGCTEQDACEGGCSWDLPQRLRQKTAMIAVNHAQRSSRSPQ